jgi:hypothetical protein
MSQLSSLAPSRRVGFVTTTSIVAQRPDKTTAETSRTVEHRLFYR